jgi:hypothetical protein
MPAAQAALARVQAQAAAREIRISLHGQDEMLDESVTLQDVLDAIEVGQILEDYPDHRRGPCCLLYGIARTGRQLHVVCTTAQPILVIITVYEPKPPKWVTPTQRRPRT